jgi:hypothetical protein
MNKIPFSFYPPGAEHDPYAPYNQDAAYSGEGEDTEGDDYVDPYNQRLDPEDADPEDYE